MTPRQVSLTDYFWSTRDFLLMVGLIELCEEHWLMLESTDILLAARYFPIGASTLQPSPVIVAIHLGN